mmetsp:Transcript_17834/g.60830  ORF Transcript_17834/g.60830 Transcript_17834/m.60830 type:complete len:1000 (-) Transcript_17834:201-3200(-)
MATACQGKISAIEQRGNTPVTHETTYATDTFQMGVKNYCFEPHLYPTSMLYFIYLKRIAVCSTDSKEDCFQEYRFSCNPFSDPSFLVGYTVCHIGRQFFAEHSVENFAQPDTTVLGVVLKVESRDLFTIEKDLKHILCDTANLQPGMAVRISDGDVEDATDRFVDNLCSFDSTLHELRILQVVGSRITLNQHLSSTAGICSFSFGHCDITLSKPEMLADFTHRRFDSKFEEEGELGTLALLPAGALTVPYKPIPTMHFWVESTFLKLADFTEDFVIDVTVPSSRSATDCFPFCYRKGKHDNIRVSDDTSLEARIRQLASASQNKSCLADALIDILAQKDECFNAKYGVTKHQVCSLLEVEERIQDSQQGLHHWRQEIIDLEEITQSNKLWFNDHILMKEGKVCTEYCLSSLPEQSSFPVILYFENEPGQCERNTVCAELASRGYVVVRPVNLSPSAQSSTELKNISLRTVIGTHESLSERHKRLNAKLRHSHDVSQCSTFSCFHGQEEFEVKFAYGKETPGYESLLQSCEMYIRNRRWGGINGFWSTWQSLSTPKTAEQLSAVQSSWFYSIVTAVVDVLFEGSANNLCGLSNRLDFNEMITVETCTKDCSFKWLQVLDASCHALTIPGNTSRVHSKHILHYDKILEQSQSNFDYIFGRVSFHPVNNLSTQKQSIISLVDALAAGAAKYQDAVGVLFSKCPWKLKIISPVPGEKVAIEILHIALELTKFSICFTGDGSQQYEVSVFNGSKQLLTKESTNQTFVEKAVNLTTGLYTVVIKTERETYEIDYIVPAVSKFSHGGCGVLVTGEPFGTNQSLMLTAGHVLLDDTIASQVTAYFSNGLGIRCDPTNFWSRSARVKEGGLDYCLVGLSSGSARALRSCGIYAHKLTSHDFMMHNVAYMATYVDEHYTSNLCFVNNREKGFTMYQLLSTPEVSRDRTSGSPLFAFTPKGEVSVQGIHVGCYRKGSVCVTGESIIRGHARDKHLSASANTDHFSIDSKP